jgi:hypothetical protein
MFTEVSILGEKFWINGRPSYPGRKWKDHTIEGLLINSRMVQGIFDDENPETRERWKYPDTGVWDPERNTREFVDSMESWESYGLKAFKLNLQGGSPEGYSKEQPWLNTAFKKDGTLKTDYMERLCWILDEADRLGMVVVIGYFYFGQDQRLRDDSAVKKGAMNATEFLLDQGYRNILVEVCNECDIKYTRHSLKAENVDKLINEIRFVERESWSFPVSASYSGQKVPSDKVIAASDFILMHGNGPEDPHRIEGIIRETRSSEAYYGKPVVFNEDDHFNFDSFRNHLHSALSNYASWGYFDPGKGNYRDGYQCPPIKWGINTPRKKSFFNKIKEITGY